MTSSPISRAERSSKYPRTVEQIAADRRRQLGCTVERMMDERRMSFNDMAKAAGVSKTCIYQIVDGKVDARASTLWGIADFFGVTLDALFGPSTDGPQG